MNFIRRRQRGLACFPVIETERLLLRQVVPEDAAAIYAILSDDEVTRYYDIETMTDPAQAAAMIRRMDQRYKRGESIRWGIVRKEDGALIGTCGYHLRPVKFRAGIGYDLARAYWRQGYMFEAVHAVLDFGFETLEFNRVEAMVMVRNDASAGLLRKLGFAEEGILKEHAFFKGRYHDLRRFALLRREWRPTPGLSETRSV